MGPLLYPLEVFIKRVIVINIFLKATVIEDIRLIKDVDGSTRDVGTAIS